jgi:hypothetical protein
MQIQLQDYVLPLTVSTAIICPRTLTKRTIEFETETLVTLNTKVSDSGQMSYSKNAS